MIRGIALIDAELDLVLLAKGKGKESCLWEASELAQEQIGARRLLGSLFRYLKVILDLSFM